MNVSELEDKIYELENAVNNLKNDLNTQSLFFLKVLSNPNCNLEEYIDPKYFSRWLMDYIIDNYQEFNHEILLKVLESPYYSLPFNWYNNKFFNEYEYILLALKNPNLNYCQKKELEKRKRKHKKVAKTL